VGNGNDADKAVFTEVIAEFQQQWQAAEPEVYVADSALYSEENLEALGKKPRPCHHCRGATVNAEPTAGDVRLQFFG
jgi:hypothetical protein